jgi:hypothetical protein
MGLILATCLVYFIYTPFDEWTYLRFLLPAIALMLVLASAVTVQLLEFAPAFGQTALVAVVTIRPRRLLSAHGRRSACVQSEVSRTSAIEARALSCATGCPRMPSCFPSGTAAPCGSTAAKTR